MRMVIMWLLMLNQDRRFADSELRHLQLRRLHLARQANNFADTQGVLLGASWREVGEHDALIGLDHEAVAENVGDLAGDGDGMVIGHRKFLGG
jgi:hypothetical protein